MAAVVVLSSASRILVQDTGLTASKLSNRTVLCRARARSIDAQTCASIHTLPFCAMRGTMNGEECGEEKPVLNRRLALLLAGFMLTSISGDVRADGEVQPLSLERYDDEKEGFTFLRPAAWNKVDKAGATLLFEDPMFRTNTVGVVVNPVRIASLKDFGTPEDVAERLIRAEKKKPSTNDAKLVRVLERDANGRPLYEVEYDLDSSRGQKRVLSAVTIAFKKLYILNVSYNDSPSKPISQDVADSLKQIDAYARGEIVRSTRMETHWEMGTNYNLRFFDGDDFVVPRGSNVLRGILKDATRLVDWVCCANDVTPHLL